MSENKYFKNALESFALDVACGDAIRHLYDLGYHTPEEILPRLDFPVSSQIITRIVDAYVVKKELMEHNQGYEYIKEVDKYGRTSFRRVTR